MPVDQRTIARRCTDGPFRSSRKISIDPSLFVSSFHASIPLYVPDEIRDPNPLNAYTCVIEHIDAEVGRIIKTLKDLKLEKNTIVIYTTDNGPWLSFKHHGGSASPLREEKVLHSVGRRIPA